MPPDRELKNGWPLPPHDDQAWRPGGPIVRGGAVGASSSAGGATAGKVAYRTRRAAVLGSTHRSRPAQTPLVQDACLPGRSTNIHVAAHAGTSWRGAIARTAKRCIGVETAPRGASVGEKTRCASPGRGCP